MKAILPGLILLFGHGTQLIWAINQMPYIFDIDIQIPFEDSSDNESFILEDHINNCSRDLLPAEIMILAYYVGGICGALIGAGLVTTFRKNIIYVSKERLAGQ